MPLPTNSQTILFMNNGSNPPSGAMSRVILVIFLKIGCRRYCTSRCLAFFAQTIRSRLRGMACFIHRYIPSCQIQRSRLISFIRSSQIMHTSHGIVCVAMETEEFTPLCYDFLHVNKTGHVPHAKDTLPAEKQSKVVYQIPCSC